jgi:hypothetical protein
MVFTGAAGAAARGTDAAHLFQVQNAGFLPVAPALAVPETAPAGPQVSKFADALARLVGITLTVQNGHADLFIFHRTQSGSFALTAGGGNSGTFLNLKWRMGE